MKASLNHHLNIIEFYLLGWDHNQAFPTMQSQPSLDWGILDSSLRETIGAPWMEELMDEQDSHTLY